VPQPEEISVEAAVVLESVYSPIDVSHNIRLLSEERLREVLHLPEVTNSPDWLGAETVAKCDEMSRVKLEMNANALSLDVSKEAGHMSRIEPVNHNEGLPLRNLSECAYVADSNEQFVEVLDTKHSSGTEIFISILI